MSSHPRLKVLAFWLAVLALTTTSLLPAGMLPPQVFSLWDKAQHALGFAGLGMLAWLAYPAHPWRMASLLLVHGGLIEFAQSATGWRHGDWLDWIADAIGIGCSCAVQWGLTRSTRVGS